MTIEQLYKEYTAQLTVIYGSREAGVIADWVFESIAGIKRLQRITNKHSALNNSTLQQLTSTLYELLQHRPVQYVLGEAWFYKMKFLVNEHVLIPRPETEELVEWIVTEIKSKKESVKIIDIGTGSGCIAIALKKELAASDITAVDISPAALLVARQNALAQSANIEFLQMNFLDESEWNQCGAVDVIVSNPPYIAKSEQANLSKNVVDYEPHLALFVENAHPFVFYEKIVLFGTHHLNNGGRIYVEIPERYADEIKEIFSYKFSVVIRKDIYGNNRMIAAR